MEKSNVLFKPALVKPRISQEEKFLGVFSTEEKALQCIKHDLLLVLNRNHFSFKEFNRVTIEEYKANFEFINVMAEQIGLAKSVDEVNQLMFDSVESWLKLSLWLDRNNHDKNLQVMFLVYLFPENEIESYVSSKYVISQIKIDEWQ